MRKLYSAINNIDDDLIENAAEITAKRVVPFKKYALIAACFVIVIGAVTIFYNSTQYPPIDLTDRIVVEEFSLNVQEKEPAAPGISGAPEISGSITADVVVNIEGIITRVSKDGLSFRLDDGRWVYITDETIIGKTCSDEEEKDSLFIEPTFRVGNSVSGFTQDENATEIEAYAIYTNWNWEDPIR